MNNQPGKTEDTMAMLVYLILCVVFVPTASAAAIANDTGRTRRAAPQPTKKFHNPEAALRGYDLTKSDIMSSSGDPGRRGQLFEPFETSCTKSNLNVMLSPDFSVSCNAHISTKIITNGREFSEYMSEQTSTGNNLQIGQDVAVTASVGNEKGSVGISTTIPPAFTRGWSESKSTQKMTKWMSNEKAILAITGASCIIQTLSFTKYQIPPFTVAFKRAIKDLHKATQLSQADKIRAFKRFIQAFGTHYSTMTKMGARFSAIFKLHENTRNDMSLSKLKDCSSKQGLKIFGIQLEDDNNRCTATDEDMVTKTGSSWSNKIVTSAGSYPEGSLSKWVAAIKGGIGLAPLNHELHPITELLSDDIITQQKITINGKKVTGIKSWMDQLYTNFCHTMGMEDQCILKRGCGYTDNCKYNEECVNSGTEWKCQPGKDFVQRASFREGYI